MNVAGWKVPAPDSWRTRLKRRRFIGRRGGRLTGRSKWRMTVRGLVIGHGTIDSAQQHSLTAIGGAFAVVMLRLSHDSIRSASQRRRHDNLDHGAFQSRSNFGPRALGCGLAARPGAVTARSISTTCASSTGRKSS